MPIRFEWDARKERRNLQKHGVGFDEASTVFADTLSITIPDPDHSDDDERWVTMGARAGGQALKGEARARHGQLRCPPGWDHERVRRALTMGDRTKWQVRVVGRYAHGRGAAIYLARYVRGGPINNHRLLDFDGTRVTFRYANHRRVGADGKPPEQTMQLAVAEFLRRWSKHVPLEHFHMVRTWGVYAATQRVALAQCRRQLLVPPVPLPEHERSGGADVDAVCPVCGRALVLSAVIPRAGAPPRHPPADYQRAA